MPDPAHHSGEHQEFPGRLVCGQHPLKDATDGYLKTQSAKRRLPGVLAPICHLAGLLGYPTGRPRPYLMACNFIALLRR